MVDLRGFIRSHSFSMTAMKAKPHTFFFSTVFLLNMLDVKHAVQISCNFFFLFLFLDNKQAKSTSDLKIKSKYISILLAVQNFPLVLDLPHLPKLIWTRINRGKFQPVPSHCSRISAQSPKQSWCLQNWSEVIIT